MEFRGVKEFIRLANDGKIKRGRLVKVRRSFEHHNADGSKILEDGFGGIPRVVSRSVFNRRGRREVMDRGQRSR